MSKVALSMEPRDILQRAHVALQAGQADPFLQIRSLVWAQTEPPKWQRQFPGLTSLETASEIWVLQQLLAVYYEARCFYLDDQGRISYQSWLCDRMRTLIEKLHPNDPDACADACLAHDL